MDRGAWCYSPWGHKESDTTKQLSVHMRACVHTHTQENALQCHMQPSKTQTSMWAHLEVLNDISEGYCLGLGLNSLT